MKNLFLIIILIVAGCASQRFASDPKEVAAYLSTQTDRPDKIKASLSKGSCKNNITCGGLIVSYYEYQQVGVIVSDAVYTNI